MLAHLPDLKIASETAILDLGEFFKSFVATSYQSDQCEMCAMRLQNGCRKGDYSRTSKICENSVEKITFSHKFLHILKTTARA